MQALYYVKLMSWSERSNYRFAVTADTEESAGELAREMCLAADARVVDALFICHTNNDIMEELP